MRIRLIEGERSLTELVRGQLGRAHDLTSATVDDVRSQTELPDVDLLVLVWQREPLGDGTAVDVGWLSRTRSFVVLPVDLVVARLGLTNAGIDYLVAPFHPLELTRRVELTVDDARSRSQVLWLGDTMLDEGSRLVERSRHPIDLTRKEFDLLAHLLRNHGLVQERAALLESVWGSQSYNPNVIEVTVSSLRHKLEEHGPRLIHTVRGIGYVGRTEL